ncbi:hypothetical protein ACSQ67_000783 [Phaseolus vulgaris]
MVSKWSAERVWESTYDLRSEATVQVKKQQNSQLYSAARPSGAKNKKSITWFISPPSGQLPFKSNHHVLTLSPNLPLGSFSVKECSMHKHTSPHTRIREVAVFRYSPCNAPQFFLSLKCKERTLQHTLLLPPLLLTEERMRNFYNRWRVLSSPMFPVSSPSIRHSLLGHYLTTTTTTTRAPTPMRKPNPSSLNPGLHSPPIHTQPHWPH